MNIPFDLLYSTHAEHILLAHFWSSHKSSSICFYGFWYHNAVESKRQCWIITTRDNFSKKNNECTGCYSVSLKRSVCDELAWRIYYNDGEESGGLLAILPVLDARLGCTKQSLVYRYHRPASLPHEWIMKDNTPRVWEIRRLRRVWQRAFLENRAHEFYVVPKTTISSIRHTRNINYRYRHSKV